MVLAGKNHRIPSLPKNDHCSPLNWFYNLRETGSSPFCASSFHWLRNNKPSVQVSGRKYPRCKLTPIGRKRTQDVNLGSIVNSVQIFFYVDRLLGSMRNPIVFKKQVSYLLHHFWPGMIHLQVTIEHHHQSFRDCAVCNAKVVPLL